MNDTNLVTPEFMNSCVISLKGDRSILNTCTLIESPILYIPGAYQVGPILFNQC